MFARLIALYSRYADAQVAPGPVGFARALLRASPGLVRYGLWGRQIDRDAVKRALGLAGPPPDGVLDDSWFRGQVQRGTGPITIVMPVYDAFDLLPEVLARIARHTNLPWHLVLVEDASADDRVRPWLRDWAGRRPADVTLLENATNLGFVGAANLGLAVARNRAGHVVLLNADAFVPRGWATRLLGPLEADPRVASVTPMSNNAEIFSTPKICTGRPIPPGAVDTIDTVAAGLGRVGPLPAAPTGVGFCMAMNRVFLDRVPQFDRAFGKGYGEEVDWCQRTRALGGVHLCQPAVFVEHRGGASFGAATKKALVARHNAIIAARYPTYDLEVQRYVRADPLLTPRMALALAHAGVTARGAVHLFIAHGMGGGAEFALEAEIAGAVAQTGVALVLRVGGTQRWRLELHHPRKTSMAATDDLAVIRRLLDPIAQLQIIYSCGVGDPDPVALPAAMASLRRPGRADMMAARIHDFFPISPSYCLLGADGRFREGAISGDPAQATRRPDGSPVSLVDWQSAWREFLTQCSEVTVFSDDSRVRVAQVYPDLQDRLVLAPHRLRVPISSVSPPRGPKPVLAVLGNINAQKGAGVLRDLARHLAGDGRDNGPALVLIGNIDPAFGLPEGVACHGSYAPQDIPAIAARYRVSVWLIPSIWPETFSFTTHEALATGLPVLAFDLGAQGEAVRAAPNGTALPFDPDADLAAIVLQALPGCRRGTQPQRRKRM